METMIALVGLMLAAWAVRVICRSELAQGKKIAFSVLAGGYFLAIGGVGGTEPEKLLPAAMLLLLGAALMWFLYRRYLVVAAG